jgi:hypothetical protein
MEYHIQFFDCNSITPWIYPQNNRVVLSTRPPGDLKKKLRKQLQGNPAFLDEAAEIRRQVIRFDKGRAVPVYYVRFPQVLVSFFFFFFTTVIPFFSLVHPGVGTNSGDIQRLGSHALQTEMVRIVIGLPYMV